MITVTVDVSANLRLLRSLEAKGKIEIHVVDIENHRDSKRISRKENPIFVIGSPMTTIGHAVVASDDNRYHELEKIIGKAHHADVLHLERHINSKRNVFVTEDNDFLTVREQLREAFGVTILTPEELALMV